jgi:hypothetical protein
VAIAETFRAQVHTLPIALRHCSQHLTEAQSTSIVRQLLFRIACGIDHSVGQNGVPFAFGALPSQCLLAVLQRKVVSHPEQPTLQVVPRPAQTEVTEQRQKDVLKNVVGRHGAQAERSDVSTEPERTLIEQEQDLLVDGPRRW